MWYGDKNECLGGFGVDCKYCISELPCGFNKDEYERRISQIEWKTDENSLKRLDIEFLRGDRKSTPEQ